MRRLLNRFDEQGYTLIESIFQLIILAVFVQLFLLFFLWKAPIENQYSNMAAIDWELFAVDMQRLVSGVQQVEVYPTGQGITFLNERGLISVEQGTGVIRKRVYGQGHVPLLTSVRTATFSLEGSTLFVYVTLLNGSQKERGFAVGLYPE